MEIVQNINRFKPTCSDWRTERTLYESVRQMSANYSASKVNSELRHYPHVRRLIDAHRAPSITYAKEAGMISHVRLHHHSPTGARREYSITAWRWIIKLGADEICIKDIQVSVVPLARHRSAISHGILKSRQHRYIAE